MIAVDHKVLPVERVFIMSDWESPKWRINNLYTVVPKEGGARVRFKMNEPQEQFYDNMWYWNLILKARQMGFTTLIGILELDQCMFNNNFSAGIVADKQTNATKIFEEKVKAVYNALPEALRNARRSTKDSASTLSLSNGSKLFVDVTMRSGTFQLIHVSEFGKICAKDPARAKELVEGTFPTLHAGQRLIVESTAEGREGRFFDYCDKALEAVRERRPESTRDFRLHFFPWYEESDNETDPKNIPVTKAFREYFAKLLDEHGIWLRPEQRAWYVTQSILLGDGMKKENPSYPEEAFEASIDGVVYRQQMEKMREENRITHVPWDPSAPVDVTFDLGTSDAMAMWFLQVNGLQRRYVRYYENNRKPIAHYIKEFVSHGYTWGTVYLPHDANSKYQGENGITTMADIFRSLLPGVNVVVGDRTKTLSDGIEKTRNWFPACWMDKENCKDGIKALDNYKYEWDDKLGMFKKEPLHNWASHGPDSLREGAQSWRIGNNRRSGTTKRHRRKSRV